jgi:hypothetical protein
VSALQPSAALLPRIEASVSAIRPQVIARETFEAFTLLSGPLTGIGTAMAIEGGATLREAVEHAATRTAHKGHFVIRETDTLTGCVMLHFYVVRQKSRGERRWQYADSRVIRDTYAEHLFDLRGDAL